MRFALPSRSSPRRPHRAAAPAGSVLIIVLWITFGIVSIALYFGHSMLLHFRAVEHDAAGAQAEQAIAGVIRYIGWVVTNYADTGEMPFDDDYGYEAVRIGDATFWLISRCDPEDATDVPVYGLMDEASKLNLNTATLEMLQALPLMTEELAAAIVDWRDTNSEATANGAESETYLRRTPPYRAKDAPFESVEELRLLSGASDELLFGEDTNCNGVLDPNENDGDATLPPDDRDGVLDPGLIEYFTVFTRESALRSDGTNRINVSSGTNQELASLLQEFLGQERAAQVRSQLAGSTNIASLLEFYIRSGLSIEEFEEIDGYLVVTNQMQGLVNVNTASAVVLACIPGLDSEKANQLVAYRRTKPIDQTSIAWVAEVLDSQTAIQAGPYLTSRTFQFGLDIVALGQNGRGYRRRWVILDTTEGRPKVIYQRDRARLGWALGAETRKDWLAKMELR
ncbi:MAG TPA: type II secretion system protein GspK [Candidatus Paceibacterota bacterium]|nr:general secretion pathway protein GspK [Verrucomicrobiota bacterium]HOX02943.1 type II secretion system protein GspK [Verrucomicrobiota bacterium]HRZ45695.1 type II secretion system protein GspK [Candidatus Paceibacterota bacterium]